MKIINYLFFIILGIIIYVILNHIETISIGSPVLFLPNDWPRDYHNFDITIYEIKELKIPSETQNIVKKFINIHYVKNPYNFTVKESIEAMCRSTRTRGTGLDWTLLYIDNNSPQDEQIEGMKISEEFGIEIRTGKNECAVCPDCCIITQINDGPLSIRDSLDAYNIFPYDELIPICQAAGLFLPPFAAIDYGIELAYEPTLRLYNYNNEYNSIISNPDLKTINYLSQPLTWDQEYMLNKYNLEINTPFQEYDRSARGHPVTEIQTQFGWISTVTNPRINSHNLKFLDRIDNIDTQSVPTELMPHGRTIINLARANLGTDNSTIFKMHGKEYWATKFNPYIQRDFYDAFIFDLMINANCENMNLDGIELSDMTTDTD